MSDSFVRQTAIVPVAIGDISVTLFDPDPNGQSALPRSATVNVQVHLSNGNAVVQRANLANHLPAQSIQNLIAMMEAIRTEAERVILPAPE